MTDFTRRSVIILRGGDRIDSTIAATELDQIFGEERPDFISVPRAGTGEKVRIAVRAIQMYFDPHGE